MPSQAANLIWVNGAPADAVSALERGLHYGDGLFETMACTGGEVRLLARHLARLARGCGRLAIAAPDPQALARELSVLAAGQGRCILKLILTRGPALARGYGYGAGQVPTRVVLRYPWEGPAADPAAGVRVRIARLRLAENPATAGIKHLNRLEQVLARAEWDDPQIAEALLFSRGGALISGTMSNVFLVRGMTVQTPRLDLCGVEGIMREVVMEVARDCGLALEERVLVQGDVDAAEEMFLTNSLTGIRRVGVIEARTLTGAAVGRRLQAALARAGAA
ncbi:MAG: aminodeoxychorismate lyase [Proteobacteria bacterium]|nr:aminodeoxychorismate lyase [Pseudomonadota bacterium]